MSSFASFILSHGSKTAAALRLSAAGRAARLRLHDADAPDGRRGAEGPDNRFVRWGVEISQQKKGAHHALSLSRVRERRGLCAVDADAFATNDTLYYTVLMAYNNLSALPLQVFAARTVATLCVLLRWSC